MRIGVLIHARDVRFLKGERWLLRFILEAARARGHSIEILQGVRSSPPLDVVIPHVDLTVRPSEYQRFLNHYELVLNRGISDISKRALGGAVLSEGDAFSGPVILKSNLNFGGRPELQNVRGRRTLSRCLDAVRGLPVARALAEAVYWRWTPCLSSRDYRVFPALRDVPRAAFRNPNLVVQPFEPEEEDGLYALRKWTFMGDAEICTRSLSPEPIVKASNRLPGRTQHIPVHDEVRAFRQRSGMDFGKIDFVVRDGRPLILDINPTPSVSTGGGVKGAARRAPMFEEALERWVKLKLEK